MTACIASNCFPPPPTPSFTAPLPFFPSQITLKLHLKFNKISDNKNGFRVSQIYLISLPRVDESQFRRPARSTILKLHWKGDKLNTRSKGRHGQRFTMGLRLHPLKFSRSSRWVASGVLLFEGEEQFVLFNTEEERSWGMKMHSPIPSR